MIVITLLHCTVLLTTTADCILTQADDLIGSDRPHHQLHNIYHHLPLLMEPSSHITHKQDHLPDDCEPINQAVSSVSQDLPVPQIQHNSHNQQHESPHVTDPSQTDLSNHTDPSYTSPTCAGSSPAADVSTHSLTEESNDLADASPEVRELAVMFPQIQPSIIEAVLEAHRNEPGACVPDLLAMSDPTWKPASEVKPPCPLL